jgi:hypothetical protein
MNQMLGGFQEEEAVTFYYQSKTNKQVHKISADM